MIEMLNRKVEFISVYLLKKKKKKRVVIKEYIIVVNERENVASEVVQEKIEAENGKKFFKKETIVFISFLPD